MHRAKLSAALSRERGSRLIYYAIGALLCLAAGTVCDALADGKLVPPRDYRGSLEEQAQEAVIIFHGSSVPGEAREDLILKITVAGDLPVSEFGWVVPFPQEPTVQREDAALFRELFDYVQRRRSRPADDAKAEGAKAAAPEAEGPIQVLSRQVVGVYDVAVVRENVAGKLNDWLAGNGFQVLEGGEDVIEFYRQKGYVFACMKVTNATLQENKAVELHPLRFSFQTGGRDGIYFPMKMTGLQSKPFDVNLYVFYQAWLNDRLNRFGYTHRGFELVFRDYDSPHCEPNAGKTYSSPQQDTYLQAYAGKLRHVSALMQKLHPGEKYYLTNLQATGLDPDQVRDWSDDLWLFPYYVNRELVPHDVRPGGPAGAAWPDVSVEKSTDPPVQAGRLQFTPVGSIIVSIIAIAACSGLVIFFIYARLQARQKRMQT